MNMDEISAEKLRELFSDDKDSAKLYVQEKTGWDDKKCTYYVNRMYNEPLKKKPSRIKRFFLWLFDVIFEIYCFFDDNPNT